MSGDIVYDVDGQSFTGFLAERATAAKGRSPGVLVLHEAGGLGDHARQKATQLAELGYVSLAADMFGGVAANLQEASGYIARLSQDPALLRRRCAAALDLLRAQPSVDPERLAVIGFCFGGQAALELARSGADLRATVGFHSGLKASNPEETRAIKGKVLVCLGDRDPLVNREARDTFMDNMTDSGIDCQMLLMSGVGHSFTNPDAQAFGVAGCDYDARADRRSWAAMRALFAEALDD